MDQPAIGLHEGGFGAPASLQQRVYEDLRAKLIGGAFAPGESLSLRRIAVASGVSPMPVREAVKRLISEGAIELLPNRTIAVPKLRRRDFIELTSVRTMLEGYAAELAAARATAQLVLQLASKSSVDSICCRQENADCDADEPGVSFRPVPRIAVSRPAPFDRSAVDAHSARSSSWRSIGPKKISWSASQHHAALQALEQRDGLAVRRAVELDIRNAADELLNLDIFMPD